MSSTIYERTAGQGGRRSGSAVAWAGGVGAALVLGGAVAVGTILTRAPNAAIPAAPARPEAANAAVAPAAPRLIDLETTHDAIRGAAWIAGSPADQPVPSATEDGYPDAGPRGYVWRPAFVRWIW